MPRAKRAATAPTTRADGTLIPGTITDPTTGQPNGRIPQGVVPPGLPYGEGGALRAAVAATPTPPSTLTPRQRAAVALQNHGMLDQNGRIQHPNVKPLQRPTERPFEHVTAGAPLAPGPTNPMAAAGIGMGPDQNVGAMLAAAAEATDSPQLRALADQAASASGSAAGGTPSLATPIGP